MLRLSAALSKWEPSESASAREPIVLLEAAWPDIVELVNDAHTPKPLLLAAIGALASIRPAEAAKILVDLSESDDEEIAEAVNDALAEAAGPLDEEDEEDEWVN